MSQLFEYTKKPAVKQKRKILVKSVVWNSSTAAYLAKTWGKW